ncbi:hypothetical protein L6452_11690 [Arctium lappa]|uniref:Uncharacterized protein n=1 Tax=Arctium lappa TaxID=4217 RepID=A0ACB9DQG3_ARCLA|nr:hypothetical protein L6452_11690 [Arctium lappa]
MTLRSFVCSIFFFLNSKVPIGIDKGKADLDKFQNINIQFEEEVVIRSVLVMEVVVTGVGTNNARKLCYSSEVDSETKVGSTILKSRCGAVVCAQINTGKLLTLQDTGGRRLFPIAVQPSYISSSPHSNRIVLTALRSGRR